MKFLLLRAVACQLLLQMAIVISQDNFGEEYRRMTDRILEKSEILEQKIDDYLRLFKELDLSLDIDKSTYISDYVNNNKKVIEIKVLKYFLLYYLSYSIKLVKFFLGNFKP